MGKTLAEQLKSLTVQAKQATADSSLSKIKELQAQLAAVKKTKIVDDDDPEEEVIQVSECLSCWEPVPQGVFICEPCVEGAASTRQRLPE